MTTKETVIAHAVVTFVDGAKRHALGLLLQDTKIQKQGLELIEEAQKRLEEQMGDIDILIPLLKHADPGVRLNAATSLLDDHYDLVLPVLHDLDETCVTEASFGAAMFLQMYGEPNSGSGFKKPDPNIFNEKPKPRQRG